MLPLAVERLDFHFNTFMARLLLAKPPKELPQHIFELLGGVINFFFCGGGSRAWHCLLFIDPVKDKASIYNTHTHTPSPADGKKTFRAEMR
jgi:hypothetical protein